MTNATDQTKPQPAPAGTSGQFRAVCQSGALMLSAGLPPSEVQWMPPGRHEITACQPKKGPRKLTVSVTPELAASAQKAVESFRAQAASGRGDLPWLDFNHSGGAAAGHVTELFWAGEDPVSGGIRARVNWTAAGASAITGREYRKISPAFFTDDKGNITAFSANLGGLVNEAAFQKNQPVWARNGAPEDTNNDTDMTEEVLKRLDAIATAVAALADKIQPVAAAAGAPPTVPAKPDGLNEAAALAAVQAAVADGRLVPANPELHESWKKVLCASADGIKILASLPAKPVPGAVVPHKTDGTQAAAGDLVQARQAAISDYMRMHGCSFQNAWSAVSGERPELFTI